MKNLDEVFMKKAINLSLKAKGLTSPNPLVGALIVKNAKIISRGYHRFLGAKHAEIEAIEKAGGRANGAALYVTLEPCTHYGRTPPCVDRIIGAGIKKIVVGMIDPNPLNNGRGLELLKAQGMEVRAGVLEDQIRKNNLSFIKYITKRVPFVTVKVGQSLDGKIAVKSGESKWITSDKSRDFTRKIRQEYDAVMVGVNTILRDNPFLGSAQSSRPVKRIIVDSNLSTPAQSNIFNQKNDVIIATLKKNEGQRTKNWELLSEKAKIIETKDHNGQVNLHDLLKKLAAGFEIANVLVEGGGALIGSLFDERLVDKVLFFISPKIIGGKDSISSVMGRGISRIDKAVRLKDVKMRRVGEDFLVEGLCVYK